MIPPLPVRLVAMIRKEGPLAFDRFMKEALYDPKDGFYATGKTRTGKRGDFLTPVSCGPVLGQLLARQADELHHALGRPKAFNLIEQGADAGWLARDILEAIQENHPKLAPTVLLHLIEPQPILEAKQRETLRPWSRVFPLHWHQSQSECPDPEEGGLGYSCELVDSFPVRIFRFRDGDWRERGVGWDDSHFCWREKEVDSVSREKIRHWNAPEVEGYTLELRPAVRGWVKDWTQKIPRGLILTLDYGFPARELFTPERFPGTLMALRGHQKCPDPLADPGQQDLTAHVNFTELEESAAREGWKNYGLTDFSRGLTAWAKPLLQDGKPPTESWIRNFRHLTHPSFFGQTHKILVQGKGLPETFHPTVLGHP